MDSFGEYLGRIGRYPLLTPDQEIELSRRVKKYLDLKEQKDLTKKERHLFNAGKKARDKLVNCNLRLVVHIARRYKGRLKSNNMEMMDLIQECAVGLQRAAELFDGARGYKFSTYSYWWIRQAITRAIDQQERLIRVPQNCLDRVYRATKMAESFTQEHGRPPKLDELAEKAELSSSELLLLLDRNRAHLSLDALMNTDDHNTPMIDLIPDTRGQTLEDVENREIAEQLELAFFRLKPQDRNVLNRYYGLNGHEPHTYSFLAQELGVSRERVRQYSQRAKKKLSFLIRFSDRINALT